MENCQVGVFMGYATREEQTLVNMRLYLPKSWAQIADVGRHAVYPRKSATRPAINWP